MNKEQKILYDFFVKTGKGVNTITFPLTVLNDWIKFNNDDLEIKFSNKQAVVNAYVKCSMAKELDKPLFEAIKTIKEWD